MSDLAATHCDRGVGGFNDCGCIILLIIILCCCGNNSGFLAEETVAASEVLVMAVA